MKSGKSDVFFLLNGILKIHNYNWGPNYNAKNKKPQIFIEQKKNCMILSLPFVFQL